MIAALVLAAGRGRRFAESGGERADNKLLQDVGGMPLVCRTLAAVLDGGLDRVIVIVDADTPEVEQAIRAWYPDVESPVVLRNPHAGGGHMTSLKMGIGNVDESCTAVMVFLADMPLVSRAVIDALLDEFGRSGKLALPECGGQHFHPRVIPRHFFQEFLELNDDQKGTVVFDRHREEVAVVRVGDPHDFLDVDCADDLARVRRHYEKRI